MNWKSNQMPINLKEEQEEEEEEEEEETIQVTQAIFTRIWEW